MTPDQQRIIETDKMVCRECDKHLRQSELLIAPSPFEPGVIIRGCPHCLHIDCFEGACDEPGCWKPASCGTPTNTVPDGFRHTCGKHRPECTFKL